MLYLKNFIQRMKALSYNGFLPQKQFISFAYIPSSHIKGLKEENCDDTTYSECLKRNEF